MLSENCILNDVEYLFPKLENHFTYPIDVYYAGRNEKGKEDKVYCGSVEPGKNFSLPYGAVYSPTAEIFLGAKG